MESYELVSPHSADDPRDRLVESGRLIPATARAGCVRSPRPVLPEPDEPTNAELLDAEREERP